MEFYPVTGDAQAQPGQAWWRLLTSLQVDNFGLLKLKFKNKITLYKLLVSYKMFYNYRDVLYFKCNGNNCDFCLLFLHTPVYNTYTKTSLGKSTVPHDFLDNFAILETLCMTRMPCRSISEFLVFSRCAHLANTGKFYEWL